MAKRCSVVFMLAVCSVLRSGQGKEVSATRVLDYCNVLKLNNKRLGIIFISGTEFLNLLYNCYGASRKIMGEFIGETGPTIKWLSAQKALRFRDIFRCLAGVNGVTVKR